MRKLKLTELKRATPLEFKKQEKHPIVLVLDNIRSASNVGAAFRTADAFGLAHVHLCGITARPPHREILKTAIGATRSMDWTYHAHTIDALRQLQSAGYTILGAEQTDESVMLQHFLPNPDTHYAIVLGNEIQGVSDEVLELLDYALEIPQFGTKHSLNVSIAAGIIIWDVLSKMKY